VSSEYGREDFGRGGLNDQLYADGLVEEIDDLAATNEEQAAMVSEVESAVDMLTEEQLREAARGNLDPSDVM
jgi:hypothetical protein